MSRTMLLFLGLLAAGGYSLAHHWDEIRVAMGVEEPTELRAMGIVKSAYCVRVDLPNDRAIDVALSDQAGSFDIERIGWRAHRVNDRIYLVRYDYRRDRELVSYVFEVDVGSTVVRSFDAEPELAKTYAQALAASAPPPRAATPPTAPR